MTGRKRKASNTVAIIELCEQIEKIQYATKLIDRRLTDMENAVDDLRVDQERKENMSREKIDDRL